MPTRCVDGQVCMSSVANSQKSFVQCTAGKFCLKGKEADCFGGYICFAGSVTPIPTDGKSGKLCPGGQYCLAGKATSTPCPAGTYNEFLGARLLSECLACSGSQNCANPGTQFPTKKTCPGGKYCKADGTNVDTDPGFYSPEGVVTQLIVPNGKFTKVKFKAAFDRCTAGNYCYSSDPTKGPTDQTQCPIGYYCPDDTAHYERYPCAIGTYGSKPGLKSSDECTACPEKFYCPKKGMTESTKNSYPCKDGYICGAGSSVATGTAACPKDSYCTAGNTTPCLAGTYSLVGGLTK